MATNLTLIGKPLQVNYTEKSTNFIVTIINTNCLGCEKGIKALLLPSSSYILMILRQISPRRHINKRRVSNALLSHLVVEIKCSYVIGQWAVPPL